MMFETEQPEFEPFETDTEILPPIEEQDADDTLLAAEELRPFDDDTTLDLVVAEEPPPALGKSWAFDFIENEFPITSAQGPVRTRGLVTLRYWIEKALRTNEGDLPIHPPGYGVRNLSRMLGRGAPDVIADLEPAIREALLFHPRITDVLDFSAAFDPDDEFVEVSFRVVTDEELELTVERTILHRESEAEVG